MLNYFYVQRLCEWTDRPIQRGLTNRARGGSESPPQPGRFSAHEQIQLLQSAVWCLPPGPGVQNPAHVVWAGFVVHPAGPKHQVRARYAQRRGQAAGGGLQAADQFARFVAAYFAPNNLSLHVNE